MRPRLRAVPLVAAANLAADPLVAAANVLARFGPLFAAANVLAVAAAHVLANVIASFGTISGRTMVSAAVFFALLQLLGRSAADIVREDTDREMATPLIDPVAPPDVGLQALFSDFDAANLAVALG